MPKKRKTLGDIRGTTPSPIRKFDFDTPDVDSFWDRVNMWSEEVVSRAAPLVGELVFSNAPNAALRPLARNSQQVFDYLDDNNRFAGLRGQLHAARLNAIHETDPAIQRTKLEFIDWLRRIPEERQQLFLLAASGVSLPTTAGGEVAAVLGEGFEAAPGEIVADPLQVTARKLAAIKQMFPDMPLSIQAPEMEATLDDLMIEVSDRFADIAVTDLGAYFNPLIDKIAILSDIDPATGKHRDYSFGEKTLAGLLFTLQATPGKIGTGTRSFRLATALGGGGRLMKAFNVLAYGRYMLGTSLATTAFARGAGALPEEGPLGAVKTVTDYMRGAGREFVGGLDSAIGVVHSANVEILDAIGIDVDSPFGQLLAEMTTLVTLVGASHSLGQVGRQIKTARGVVPEAAAEILKPGYVRRAGPLGTLGYLVGMPVRGIKDLSAGFALKFVRDPQKFFNSNAGTRVVETLWNIKQQYGRTAVGEAARIDIKNLPIDVVREVLKESSPEAMRYRLIDMWNDPVKYSLPKLEARVKTVRKELNTVTAEQGARGNTGESIRNITQKQASLIDEIVSVEQELASLRASGQGGFQVNQLAKRVAGLKQELQGLEATRNKINVLEARERVLQYRIRQSKSITGPIVEYPKIKAVRQAAIAPVTRGQRLVHNLFLRPTRAFRAVDELPRQVRLWASGIEAPVDWLHRNVAAVVKVFERANLPRPIARELLTELIERVKSRQDMLKWAEKASEQIAVNLPKGTDPAVLAAIRRIFDHELEGRYATVIHEEMPTSTGGTRQVPRSVVEREVRPGEYRPGPSRPTDFVDDFPWIDVELLIEATSIIRRGKTALGRIGEKVAGTTGRAIAEAWYTIPKLIGEMSTNYLKPLIMLERLPAMGMRIQLEQAFRNLMFGEKPIVAPRGLYLMPGGIPVPTTVLNLFIRALGGREIPKGTRLFGDLFGKTGFELLGKDPRFTNLPMEDIPHDIGMLMHEMNVYGGRRARAPEQTTEYNVGAQRNVPNRVFKGALDALEQASKDRLDVTFVRLGFNIEKMKRALETDPFLKHWFETEMKSVLEEYGMSVDTWLANERQYILELTNNGNPIYLEAIRRGGLPETPPKPENVREMADIRVQMERIADRQERLSLEREGQTDPAVLQANADAQARLVEEWTRLNARMQELSGLGPAPKDRFSEESVKYRYDTVVHNIDLINERLRGLMEDKEVNIDAIGILQKERLGFLHVKELLERAHGSVLQVDRAPLVRFSETRSAVAALKREFEEGRYNLPTTVMTERLLGDVLPLGVGESLRAMSWAAAELMYRPFKLLTRLDTKGTRGSLYWQFLEREARVLERLGYDKADAHKWAQVRAAERTKDVMYDLAARTSLQRALKDVFWFAPAWQEVLYTWAVKIPSQSYWPIGAVALAGQGAAIYSALRDFGIVKKDPNGEDIIVIPGVGPAIEKLAGIKIPDVVFAKLSGFNLVTSGGLSPGLSPIPNFFLGKAAVKYGGVFKLLSEMLQPYGPEGTIVPQPIFYFWESVFGEPPPFEFLSREYAKTSHDRAYDQALQYAYAELAEGGVTPPRIEDYADTTSEVTGKPTLSAGAQEKYLDDDRQYSLELFELADQYHQGVSLLRLLGSTVSPASLYATSTEKEAWQQFWQERVIPAGYDKSGALSEAQRRLIDQYLLDHPNSMAYSVYYNTIGEQKRELPWEDTGDGEYWEKLYTGEVVVMEPERFARKLQYSESMRFYVAQLNQALKGIGDTAPKQLVNGWERAQALLEYREQRERYLALHPEAEADLAETRRLFAEKYGTPVATYEAERLAETIFLLNRASAMFTGETGIRQSEVKGILAELKALYSDIGEFGEPETKVEKDRAWYFDNVLTPYIEATAPLYEKAQDMQARGLNAGPVYDQIREIGQQYVDRTHGGLTYPSPEEVFYGNRNPVEQEAAVYAWTTRPMTWLSEFQFEQVGYESTSRTQQFLENVRMFEDEYRQILIDRDVAPSSEYADTLAEWRIDALQGIADQYSETEQELLSLYLASPATRLVSTGFGADSPAFQEATLAANEIWSRLESEGLSPQGFSQTAVYYKGWFYQTLEDMRQRDPAFDHVLTQLAYTIPERGFTYREGIPLYEAIFFGNFSAEFIPPEILAIRAGG